MNRPLTDTARLMLALADGEIVELLVWLNGVRRKYENLLVYHWTDDLWYIEIEDEKIRLTEGRDKARVCVFTVSIQSNKILWSNQQENNIFGNCCVRSTRWVTLLRRMYAITLSAAVLGPLGRANGKVYDYRPKPQRKR